MTAKKKHMSARGSWNDPKEVIVIIKVAPSEKSTDKKEK
jgi:hypothetical protein